jgi:hypothetical protein
MAPTNSLSTYLQDHLAGAAAGSEIARRIADEYRKPPLGTFLADLARDIEMDKATLERIMADLEISQDRLKQSVAWVGEKLSRLKLSEAVTGDPTLKQMMEFEILSMGIEGKSLLWHALARVANTHPALAAIDFGELQKRAQLQREGLEAHRLVAAQAALTAA